MIQQCSDSECRISDAMMMNEGPRYVCVTAKTPKPRRNRLIHCSVEYKMVCSVPRAASLSRICNYGFSLRRTVEYVWSCLPHSRIRFDNKKAPLSCWGHNVPAFGFGLGVLRMKIWIACVYSRDLCCRKCSPHNRRSCC